MDQKRPISGGKWELEIGEDVLYLKLSSLCAAEKNELHEGVHTT